MTGNSIRRYIFIGLAATLAATGASAQEHQWAGRTLNDLEWTIHENLASIPFHTVFDDIRFELHEGTVTLTGNVLRERVKQNAERAVRRVAGVQNVVNRIEVLPASQRDEALRMNVYRAIYERQPLEKYGTRELPPIQIIVKNGWVALEGVVDSEDDRGTAYLRAVKVTPHVSDNLRVASQGL